MYKKQNPISARKAAEKAVVRDEQNRRIEYAATNPVKGVLQELHTTLCGLDAQAVSAAVHNMAATRLPMRRRNLWQGGWLTHLSILLPPSCSFWPWYLP